MNRTLAPLVRRLGLLLALLAATGAGGVAPASATAPLAQLNWTP
jgi:hypothetical protein